MHKVYQAEPESGFGISVRSVGEGTYLSLQGVSRILGLEVGRHGYGTNRMVRLIRCRYWYCSSALPVWIEYACVRVMEGYVVGLCVCACWIDMCVQYMQVGMRGELELELGQTGEKFKLSARIDWDEMLAGVDGK